VQLLHSCIITKFVKKVKKNLKANQATAATGGERTAQRGRTRAAIVDATMRLVAAGGTPSMAEIADEAQVSRRTVYLDFPTLEQLLIDATLGALSATAIDPVVEAPTSNDPVTRIEQLSRAFNQHSGETMRLGRALIRLTVEGEEPQAGGPRRGYRRVQWIERTLEPAREKLSRAEFNRLVSALCVLIGWEPLVVLKDVRGLDGKEADDVLTFAVRAVVEKALESAQARVEKRRRQA
jgi:AcrR family transcriptional regulator